MSLSSGNAACTRLEGKGVIVIRERCLYSLRGKGCHCHQGTMLVLAERERVSLSSGNAARTR